MKLTKIQFIIVSGLALLCLSMAASRQSDEGKDLSQKELYDHVRSSTISLRNPENVNSGGTGSVVTRPTGEAVTLTNAHICLMSKLPYMIGKSATSTQRLAIIAIAEDTDLCILQPMQGLKPLRLARTMEMYERIFIVGHPNLLPVAFSEGFVNSREDIELITFRDVSAEECAGNRFRMVMVESLFGYLELCAERFDANWSDAKIYPGNSGSSVTNKKGEVVGVAFAGTENNSAFFIPLDLVKKFLSGQ